MNNCHTWPRHSVCNHFQDCIGLGSSSTKLSFAKAQVRETALKKVTGPDHGRY